MDDMAQQKAIADAGFACNDVSISTYRRIVVDMSIKEREPYFFLRANDLYFRPWVKPVGKNIDCKLHTREKQEDGEYATMKIKELPLEDKRGYFVVAAPST